MPTLTTIRSALHAIPAKPKDGNEHGNEILSLQLDQYYTVILIGKHKYQRDIPLV